jgi:hypothetical protein
MDSNPSTQAGGVVSIGYQQKMTKDLVAPPVKALGTPLKGGGFEK